MGMSLAHGGHLTNGSPVNFSGRLYNFVSYGITDPDGMIDYDALERSAGEYTSLRIMIGEAVGRNWWGVLFPQLCTGAASAEKELKKTGFTSDQIKILTESESPKYKIKFKILEIFS